MADVERSALVNFSALQMFNLVNDVARYSEFLPGCVSSQVIEQTDELMVGMMELKKGPVAQTFTTRNTLLTGQSIAIELQDGPFEYLHGKWTFKALNDVACKVELELSFKFSSKLAAVAFSGLFNNLVTKLVDSFVTRAQVVYAS
ncbi:MAG: ubiquinone-binding protein [Gammaproteobacteria bacterium]|nr:MAG: ubiquinone-binding protein [Gammaproteobacteria bacterium]